MKKIIVFIFTVACLCSVSLAMTPVRESITLAAGSGSYTNNRDYQIIKLVGVEVYGTQPAANTQAVVRVTSGNTNSIGSVVAASGSGSLAVTSTVYLFKGDVLQLTGSTNAGTAYIIGEVYP